MDQPYSLRERVAVLESTVEAIMKRLGESEVNNAHNAMDRSRRGMHCLDLCGEYGRATQLTGLFEILIRMACKPVALQWLQSRQLARLNKHLC